MFENAIKNRYEFVMLYDVENGNPNGDPDAGNMPRIDPETGHGIVTDVCIKRKIRNYVEITKAGQEGLDIYVRQDVPLNEQDKKGVDALISNQNENNKNLFFRDFMCNNFFDIRAFGAVMTTAGKKEQPKSWSDEQRKAATSLRNVAGQVRGPVQIAFGRSIDPIAPREITITRVAITTEEKAEKASTEMGRKHIVPYGLYRQEGFISANLAQSVTGFSDADLELLWEAITNMFEFDHSAARGKMALRELIIFKHETELGNASAQKLFDLVSVVRNDDIKVPRSYRDYKITVSEAPDGVEVIRMN
jgi:CRISPR-associated protein Csd2